MAAWLRRGAPRRGGAAGAAALALALAAAPGQSVAQSDEVAAEGESFSARVGRVFAKALEAPLDWVDPDEDPSSVCLAPASKEPVENEVIERLATVIDETWRPISDTLGEDTPQIVLEICIGANGESLQRPRLLRPSGALSPAQSTALLRALEVTESAAPFVEPVEYGPWRRVIVVFDPSLTEAGPAPSPGGGGQ